MKKLAIGDLVLIKVHDTAHGMLGMIIDKGKDKKGVYYHINAYGQYQLFDIKRATVYQTGKWREKFLQSYGHLYAVTNR